MRRLLVALALMSVVGAVRAAENPIYTMFPDELTFFLSFDAGTTQPDVGAVAAPAKPSKVPSYETVEDGVFGRALSAGRVEFTRDMDGKRLLDLSASGTVVCWIRYMNPVPKGQNPGITFFSATLDKTATRSFGRILMMKQQGASLMNAFYEYVTDKRRAVDVNRGCSYANWKPGEWKMCVMTWTQDKLGLSLDGAPVYEQAYSERFGTVWRFTLVAPDIRGTARGYQLDEVAILDRKLSDEEIKCLYDASRAASGK